MKEPCIHAFFTPDYIPSRHTKTDSRSVVMIPKHPNPLAYGRFLYSRPPQPPHFPSTSCRPLHRRPEPRLYSERAPAAQLRQSEVSAQLRPLLHRPPLPPGPHCLLHRQLTFPGRLLPIRGSGPSILPPEGAHSMQLSITLHLPSTRGCSQIK